MKIRNGFVSNSSSSSFIVMFKKFPKSVDEVRNILWPNNPNGALHLDYHENVLPYQDAAKIIFDDINSKYNVDNGKTVKFSNKTKENNEAIIELLYRLYYVDTNPSSYRMGLSTPAQCCPYLSNLPVELQSIIGTNTKLIQKLIDLKVEEDKLWRAKCDTERKFIIEKLGNRPVYKGEHQEKPDGSQLYTKKEIEQYQELDKKYQKRADILYQTKEYKNMNMAGCEKSNKNREEVEKIILKLTKDDLKALKKAYPKHKICLFSFSDDSETGCILENAGTFKNVPHIEINQLPND